MKGFIKLAFILLIAVAYIGCASKSKSEDDIAMEGEESGEQVSSADGADEFSDFDNSTQAEEQPEQAAEEPPPAEPAPVPMNEEPPPTETITETPPPAPVEKPVEITGLKFKANDNGGTLVVEATGPMTYTTRSNTELRQFIIEVPNSILPEKLKRNLNTKDMEGAIGSIDAYQNPGSNTSRIVIQLREGAQDPAVQAEGRTLLIVASGVVPTSPSAQEKSYAEVDDVNVDLSSSKILSSQSLQEFLSGNTQFYGKKISIEMNNMEVKDALKFIMEESGANMVISDEIKGTISLKLRQVPWDQALVVLMRAKKLGYARQGSVLRISTLEDLKKEEDDANKMAKEKQVVEPLKVRVFPISYAKVEDLEKRLKDFLTPERGKIAGDPRTSSLIVTDLEEVLNRIDKLVRSLDVQPPQVMIEGKIIEASEEFNRSIGINWGFDGEPMTLRRTSKGPLNLQPTLRIAPTVTSGAGNLGNPFNFNMTLGRLDFLGNLDATLLLNERDNKIKIISSPRVVTLTNEPAKISQVTQIPIRKVTVNQNAPSVVGFEFKDLTLSLDVTPQVTGDSSIVMKVKVKREIAGSAIDVQNEAFSVNTREADTKVLVRNGETTVIGGVYQSDVADADTGVPVLKDIPFIGRLFKQSTTRRSKNELLIFLTPRILNPIDTSVAPTEVKDL